MNLLDIQNHRPYPPPQRPWIIWQAWDHLLFAHWPVPTEKLQEIVPDKLRIDHFDGTAWLGIIPFEMSITPRGLHNTPVKRHFLEINVRTYVTDRNQHPGIYFFSLDADDLLSVLGARLTYRLPYCHARIKCTRQNGIIHYQSHRRQRPGADFEATYEPASDVFQSQPGSLAYWLTERYCLFTVDGKGQVYTAEIHHPPWQLQNAQAEIHDNTMVKGFSIGLAQAPAHLMYAAHQEVFTWPLQAQ